MTTIMMNLLMSVATEILVTQMTLVLKMVVKNWTHLTQIGLFRHFLSFLAVLGIYAETMPRSPKKSKSGNLILLMVPTPKNSETF